MSSNIRNRFIMAILIVSPLFITQCSKEESNDGGTSSSHDTDYYASKYLRDEYMDVYYYWADQVREANKKLDLDSYTTSEAFEKMLYSQDRWSWMTDAKTYLNSSTGNYTGTWGAAFTQPVKYYNDYGIYINLILPGSPFEKYGVTRGAKLIYLGDTYVGDGVNDSNIEAINKNIYQSPNSFVFKLVDGTTVEFTESMATSLTTDYVICHKIFTEEDFPGLPCPVGYFNYLSFEQISTSTMDEVMSEFKNAGVAKIIVDLRYNGGGSSDVCQRLISYLAPKGLEGKPFVTQKHNNTCKSLDKTRYLGSYDETSKTYSDMSVGADEIYFIMHNQSASASEVAYNGLKPYLKEKIHHIGQQSYGKPNGMYTFFYPGTSADNKNYKNGDYSNLVYVFFPICFYNKNSEGEDIPCTTEKYSGFTPENECPDDVFNDFGVNESNIFACLTHIVTGQYPELDQTHVKSSVKSHHGIIVKSLTTEAQTAGNYGVFYDTSLKKND